LSDHLPKEHVESFLAQRPCPTCNGTGSRAGARECFVPRPGKVFFQADYPQLELYTLAQCCMSWFGESKLAEAINAGIDPHLEVASKILDCTYAEAEARKKTDEVKEARGGGKILNFGKPGGLGNKSLVSFAKKAYGVVLTERRAKELSEFWFAAWPEMQLYFARVNSLCDNDSGKATAETLFTQRYRGQASYCATCNNGFQALGVDCAKEALWRIAKAQYVQGPGFTYGPYGKTRTPVDVSPLFNTRTGMFVHDEVIGECDRATPARPTVVHDAAFELCRHMVEGANKYLIDVPMLFERMEPTAMYRWSKSAVQVFNADGLLTPWS